MERPSVTIFCGHGAPPKYGPLLLYLLNSRLPSHAVSRFKSSNVVSHNCKWRDHSTSRPALIALIALTARKLGCDKISSMKNILSNSDFIDGGERDITKAVLDAAEEKLRGLCASHAGTFVAVERRGAALEASLSDLLQKLTSVQAQVATTQQSLEQDDDSERSLASLAEKHRVRRRTLLQHTSLLELLELPSLMDACVRSNLYDEALSITAFANTLERRHTEKNQVVLNVIAQVRSRQGDLKRHLLQCLKNPVTMPKCLEVITSLRRLNSIDLERQSHTNLERVHGAMEMALQVDFLEARDSWLDLVHISGHHSTLGENESGDRDLHSSEKLLDIVERYRTRYVDTGHFSWNSNPPFARANLRNFPSSYSLTNSFLPSPDCLRSRLNSMPFSEHKPCPTPRLCS
jgi:Dor1-like family